MITHKDTQTGQHVNVSLNIDIIPWDFSDAGQYIVTIQAMPFEHKRDAEQIATAMREALESRLGIRFDEGMDVS